MKQFEAIEQMLDLELKVIAEKQIKPIEKATQSIQACSDCLKKIKALMAAHHFDQENKEIRFFRHMKPRILAKQLYYIYVRNLEEYISLIDDESRRKYYRKKLKKIRTFQKKNDYFIKYYKSGQTHLDNVYFKRLDMETLNPDDPELIQYDASFCTSHDCKAAKVIAKEELAKYIAAKITELKAPLLFPAGQDTVAFQWTDTKAALVELIYALSSGGSINGGRVEVAELADFFGKAFNVDLSDIYQSYGDIKSRKGNKAKYMTYLIERFIDRFNQ